VSNKALELAIPQYANAVSIRWSDEEVVMGFAYKERDGELLLVSKIALPWGIVAQMVESLASSSELAGLMGPTDNDQVH